MAYSQKQLSVAFDKVKDQQHWKNPINALIDPGDRDIVYEAIIHFTGSIPSIVKSGKQLRVRAHGYYATMGG